MEDEDERPPVGQLTEALTDAAHEAATFTGVL